MLTAPALLSSTQLDPVGRSGSKDFDGSVGILNSFNVGSGNRADMLDIVTNISPMDTLHQSGFEKVSAEQIRTHDWLVDQLSAFGDAP